jgi:hypothetical protein
MAVTRINNNQITDAVQGNVYVGINANTKIQNFSITAQKIANNLTYGSDLTIAGNLTVQGNSTAIDTTITTIEDPVIVLASTQTGTPAVDIGFIGDRGDETNIAFVWDESAQEFVTVYTNTSETNTTVAITGYANARVGNMIVGGTTSLAGNVIGAANFTGNVTGGNLLTPGLISATGNVTGGNVLTGGLISATANITGGNLLTSGNISATANITGGNIISGNAVIGNINVSGDITVNSLTANTYISAIGNVQAGNVLTGGLISSTGTVTGGNLATGGTVSATGNATFGNVSTTNLTGTNVSVTGTVTAASTVGGVITGSSSSVTGTQTAASTVGGVITGSSVSVTGNVDATDTNSNVYGTTVSASGTVTAASTVGGVITGSSVSVTGNVNATDTNSNVYGTTVSASGTVTAASTVGGVITGSSVSVTGNVDATSTNSNVFGTSVSASGTVTAASTVGGVITGSSTSVTGSQTAASTVGGVITGSSSSVTGTQTAASTVGGVITGSSASVSGNVTGGNLVSNTVTNATAMTVSTNAGNINIEPAGNIVVNNTYINGLQLTPVQDADAASKYYVDTIATTGITIHEAVFAATISNLATATGGTITYAQPNGAANGIGATLTTTGTYTFIDTANIQTVGTRILVKDQANAVQNGVYVYSNATVITRSIDTDQYGADSAESFSINDYFFTTSGNVNAGTAFVVSAPPGVITFGTSNIEFGVFSQSQVYSANTSAGLSLTGTVFSAKVDNNTTAFDGLGNISVKAGANLTTPNIGAATGTSLSVTGAVTAASTVGGVITGSSVSVTGAQTAASTVGGVITGSSVSVTGNVDATNTNSNVYGTTVSASGTVTAASTVGGVITGSSSSVTGTQTAASTVGGVITGSSVSVTGNVNATDTNSNVYGTTVSVSGTVTAASTVGGVITGSSSSVTGAQTAASTVGGIITGTSVSVTGNVDAVSFNGNVFGTTVSASGNVTGGNILTSGAGGAISGTGNITGGNILSGGLGSFTGNVTAANFFGNIVGNVDAAGSNTQVQFNDTGDILGASAGFTFDKTANLLTVTGNVDAVSFNGNVYGTTVSVSGNVTASNTNSNVYGTTVSASGNITGGNINTTGTLIGGNIVISGDDITDTNGRVNFNTAGADVDFAVNGDTVANVFYVDAGTGTASFGNSTQTTNALVAFNTSTSILFPVGNTQQRPATGVTGMLRFNTTNNAVEVYDNSAWTSVGVPVFTVVADEQFNGDGSTVAFTLGSTQTTNSCIVSINGVVQIPILAYAVAGTDPTCVLTFTEAPEPGDIIDVRQITTTTSVTSIANSSGNAVIAVSDTSATIVMTGDLEVTGNVSVLGGIATDRILNGSTDVNIPIPDGTVHIDVGGVGNVVEFFTDRTVFKGNVLPFANVTYNLGNATNRWNDLWLSNSTIYLGNAQISANATAIVMTNPAGGQTVLGGTGGNVSGGNVTTGGLISATGNITGGNVLTGGIVSAGGNITGGNISATNHTGTNVSVTGTTTAASVVGGVITGSSTSVSGTVTGGNLVTAGSVTVNSSNGATAIVNGGTNGVGNIGASGATFNTIFAKATTAQYADLAEKYTADAAYAPGTVLVFGGTAEVTVDAVDSDRRVAGVVSTNPGFVMNEGLDSEFAVAMALTGRVPCMVIGPVRKGDLMVAAGLGRARAEPNPQVGTVIGKALEDFDGAEGTIEVVVGRF